MKYDKKPKVKKIAPDLQISYAPEMLEPTSSEQLEAGNVAPIFKIIKVARKPHIDKWENFNWSHPSHQQETL